MLLYIVTCVLVSLSVAHYSHVFAIPSPGIYAVITLPVLSLTLAIFRSPELGFFGFVVPTFRHTPFSSGLSFNCGDRSLRAFRAILPCRRTCINVHLCARDDGVGRAAKAGVLFWKAEAAIDGRIDRAGAKGTAERIEGRARRRKSVRGIMGGRCGVARDVGSGQKFEMQDGG